MLANVKTDALGYAAEQKSTTVTVVKSLLASDKGILDLVDLSFDPKKLSGEVQSILKDEKRARIVKEKQEQQRQETERKKQRKEQQAPIRVIDFDTSDSNLQGASQQLQRGMLEDERKNVLGYGMTKQEFVDWIKAQGFCTPAQLSLW